MVWLLPLKGALQPWQPKASFSSPPTSLLRITRPPPHPPLRLSLFRDLPLLGLNPLWQQRKWMVSPQELGCEPRMRGSRVGSLTMLEEPPMGRAFLEIRAVPLRLHLWCREQTLRPSCGFCCQHPSHTPVRSSFSCRAVVSCASLGLSARVLGN